MLINKTRSAVIYLYKILYRHLRVFLYPVLTTLYRNFYNTCPEFVLSSLEIANSNNREDFNTIIRIIDKIENFNGNIIECGTYQGDSLI